MIKSTQPTPSVKGLVSLEGNTSIISTQLRLLPPSPKVLILPPLSAAVKQPENDVPFDAQAFILHVHEVLSARLDLARSFLQSSSGTQPQLVFMNGGSAGASATCIAAIREKVTEGNAHEAEELFNAIAKGGVAGLLREGGSVEKRKENDALISKVFDSGALLKRRDTRPPSMISHNEPSVADAADFIDRLIDSLQKPLPRLPVEGADFGIANSSEHTRTTATPVPPDVPRLQSKFWTDQQIIPRTQRSSVEADRGQQEVDEGKHGNYNHLSYLRCTSRESSSYTDTVVIQERTSFDKDSLAAKPERPASAPSSHELVKQINYSYSYVDGKLCRHMVKKAKSIDDLRKRDAYATSLDTSPHILSLEPFTPFTFSPLLRSETSSVSDSEISELSISSSTLDFLPATTYDRAEKTVRKSLSGLQAVSNDHSHAYTGHGIDTGDSESPRKTYPTGPDGAGANELAPFEPLFEMVEDIVIQFKDRGSNGVLDTVVQCYKGGSYPIVGHTVLEVPTAPTSPVSLLSSTGTTVSGASHDSANNDEDWPHGAPEVDTAKISSLPLEEHSIVSTESSVEISLDSPPDSPSVYPSDEDSFAQFHGASKGKSLLPNKEYTGRTVHGILKPRLQISVANPAAPPPELITDTIQKIHELSDTSTTNAVTLQNSFRGVLKIRYPPETTHYKQHIFALENDRFWKPVFRMNAKQEGENRTVDQIIALGYEDGVEKALYNDLVEQFDRLGTDATGMRASKLDIRFLVIYAMQTFTSQPLSLQAGENPFAQPSLLATLLIPHLETFLSSSCPTRLLILHYPATHLSTVLALRDLLGHELMKVAGIIDSTAISPHRPSKERPDSIASINQWVSKATSKSPLPTQEGGETRPTQISRSSIMLQPSFSRADFLLLSPASEDEISNFLASVWDSLTFPSSSSSVLDNILSPSSTLHPVTSPSTASSHNPPPTPPPDRQLPTARSRKLLSPTRAPKRVSFVESITSTEISTENARRREGQSEKDCERLESQRRERLSEKAWESFIMGNDSDESLLELERIFMPHLHFMPRTVQRIGDSRKALKWLGLD